MTGRLITLGAIVAMSVAGGAGVASAKHGQGGNPNPTGSVGVCLGQPAGCTPVGASGIIPSANYSGWWPVYRY